MDSGLPRQADLPTLRRELTAAFTGWAEGVNAPVSSDGGDRLPGPLRTLPHRPVSRRHLYVEDPTFEDPDDDTLDPLSAAASYKLLHSYLPRVLSLYASRALAFEITTLTGDRASAEAASSVGGKNVQESGFDYFLLFHGVVSDDWSAKVPKICWGERGDLRWHGFVLFEPNGMSVGCSHRGGELVLWLPDGVSEQKVRSLFPKRVTLRTFEFE